MRYTHGFDLVYKILLLAGCLFLTASSALLLEAPCKAITTAGEGAGVPMWVYNFIGVIGAIAAFIGSMVLLQKTVLNPILPTYLYIRSSLMTPVSWKEAETLEFLFQGDTEGRWYPLHELCSIPEELRRETLFEFADRITRYPYGFSNIRPGTTTPPAQPPQQQPPQVDPAVEQYDACCAILGVPPSASIETIKTAYRTKMKQYHPDIFGNSTPELRQFAEEKSKLINNACDYIFEHHGSR